MRLDSLEKKDTLTFSAVPICQDISAAEIGQCAKFKPNGRASRRMLVKIVLAAVIPAMDAN